jgi:hypothetical protein
LGNNNKKLITRLKNIRIAIIWLITSIVLSEIFPLHISMATSIAIFVLILWYMRISAKKQNTELANTDIDNGSSKIQKRQTIIK